MSRLHPKTRVRKFIGVSLILFLNFVMLPGVSSRSGSTTKAAGNSSGTTLQDQAPKQTTIAAAEEEQGLFGSSKPTATSLIQFATDEFAIGEGSGHIDISVTRAGDASSPATINFNTFDQSQAGHASQNSDYEIALGKLTFNPGETSRTFRILIVNDSFVEGDETVGLAISNPIGSGVGLGSPNIAELRIIDNDSSPPLTNPIDDAPFFVRQHYLDFLNREPDTAGFNFWVDQITSCGTEAACREVKRINVSAAFFLAIEYQKSAVPVYRTYLAAFGVPPSTPAVLYDQFERDTQMLQQNLVVGQPNFDATLEANKQAYFADFVTRPEFVSAYATTLTPTQFVDNILTHGAVGFTPAERAGEIDEFGGATNTADQAARARVLRRAVENTNLSSTDSNKLIVALEYFGYLRRDPDVIGFSFWVDKLNQFGGNIINAEMVKAFITSGEYRQRFGPN
jgi:hypothetical protein